MEQKDVGDLSHSQSDPDFRINKADLFKDQPEKVAAQSAYSTSSIQKSRAEAIVLTYAAGLPVLQPPPRTHVKNIYETTAYSVGSSVQSGGASAPAEGIASLPQRKTTPTSPDHKKSVLDLDDVMDFVRNLIALIISDTEQIGPDSGKGNQSLKLMLSAMALEMLYLSVYGGMTGEEFTNLIHEKVDLQATIKPLAEQLINFIRSQLPKDAKARQEAMSKLVEFVDTHKSMAYLFKATDVLSQVLAKGGFEESKTSVQGVEDFMKSLDQVEQTKDTIIASIVQNYNKNLSEFSERMQSNDIQIWMQEVSDKGTESPTEYYAFILARSATQSVDGKNALIERFSQALNQWIIEPNTQFPLSGEDMPVYPSSAFIAGSMVCGVDIVRDAIKNTTNIFQHQLQNSPVADVLFAAAPSVVLTPDYQAAAALIVALLNNGAVYKATEDALKQGKEKNSPPRDLDFAIQYARHIISIVKHKSSIFSQHKEIQERDRLIRLMLTVMALNMVYRSAYGGMTGEEFGAILKGETSDIHDRIKLLVEQLAGLIKANLPVYEEVRAETILKLMDYIDRKDSIDSMLQSTRILANLLSTKDVDQKRWEVQSG